MTHTKKQTKRTHILSTSLLSLALTLPLGSLMAQEHMTNDDITTILIQDSSPADAGATGTGGVSSSSTTTISDPLLPLHPSDTLVMLSGKDSKDKKRTNRTNDKSEAEKFCRHEFSLWGSGGLSTLYYDPTFGDRKGRMGWNAGVGYSFYVWQQWSIQVGAELATYNARMDVDRLTDAYDTNDVDGQPIEFRTTIRNYEEKQALMNLNIPINIQFQTKGKHKLFAIAGFKFGIPLDMTYKGNDATLETSGYYYEWNQVLTQQSDLNYGTYSGSSKKESINPDYSYTGAFELGIKWTLSKRFSLYTGGYFDYTFNDIMKKHDDKFLDYSTDQLTNFTQNSVLTSEYTLNGNTKKFVDKVQPMSLGLKVRLGVNLCKGLERDKKEKAEKLSQKNGYAPMPYGYPGGYAPAPQSTGDQLPMDKATLKRLLKEVKDEEDQMKDIIREVLSEERQRAAVEYGTNVKEVIVMNIDGYSINESNLSPKLEAVLIQKMDQLKKYKNTDAVIICEGHTCDIGKADYNMLLGLERANVIRNYLIKNGFNPDNVIATSKGEDAPAVPNTSESNRRMNRRVVFIVK